MVPGLVGSGGRAHSQLKRIEIPLVLTLCVSRDREKPPPPLRPWGGVRPREVPSSVLSVSAFLACRQCLLSVPEALEIFICDEKFGLPSAILAIRHLQKKENSR